MLEWVSITLRVCVLLSAWTHVEAAIEDGAHMVVYRNGLVRSIDEWKIDLQQIISDIDGNGTSYEEKVMPIGECSKELDQHQENLNQNSKCSLLLYKKRSPHIDVSSSITNHEQDNIQDSFTSNVKTLTDSPGTETPPNAEKPTAAEVWGFGILAVGIISLSGLFGALFWPLMKTDIYAQMMWILIGLAVGSLTASATFQLIPESFKLKDFNEDYLTTAVFMWSSFWALYMFEALSKILLHSSNTDTTLPDTAPSDQQLVSATVAPGQDRPHEILELDGLLPIMEIQNGLKPSAKNMPLYMSQSSIHTLAMKKSSGHKHSHGKPGLPGKMAPVAWMIIIGDGIHNFVDGMSIGAGFSHSIEVGTSISIAIACEEFPHELGDFAILINSGMSVKRALLYNFLSACTAFAGLVLGILLGEIDGSIYIFAFAGGLFLYIALTDLMPELNEMIATGLETSKKTALFVLLLQNVGIFIGATILYLVTRLQISV